MSTRIGELLAMLQTDREPHVTQAIWEAVERLVDQRRKLAETERKRLVDMQQMMTAEQIAVLIGALTDAVKRHVDQPATLAAISTEFDRLFRRADT